MSWFFGGFDDYAEEVELKKKKPYTFTFYPCSDLDHERIEKVSKYVDGVHRLMTEDAQITKDAERYEGIGWFDSLILQKGVLFKVLSIRGTKDHALGSINPNSVAGIHRYEADIILKQMGVVR